MTQKIISPSDSTRPSAHAHKVVLDMAIEMAHELYSTMMSDNQWYDHWKRANPRIAKQPRQLEARFVQKNLALMLPQARAMLAGALSRTTDPALAETIYEALLLDNTLTRGRPGSLKPLSKLITEH